MFDSRRLCLLLPMLLWGCSAQVEDAGSTAALLTFAPEDVSTDASKPSSPRHDKPKPTVTVMTRNVYHGVDAELFAVAAAADVPELLNRVADVYNGYHARNFPERAEALAQEIEEAQPDLIGLQEAVLVRTGPFGDPAPATTVDLDYAQILVDALAMRGLEYEVVMSSLGFDAELPSALGFDVRHTDREVLLVRSDLGAADLKLSNPQKGNFVTNCEIPGVAVGPIPVLRGWVAVDVKVRGSSVRFLTDPLVSRGAESGNFS